MNDWNVCKKSMLKTLFFLGFVVSISCDSGMNQVQQALVTFNSEAESVVTRMDEVTVNVYDTYTALEQDDIAEAGKLIEARAKLLDKILASLDRLESAEEIIIGEAGGGDLPSDYGTIKKPLGFIAAGLVLGGLALFCKKLKEKQQEASAAWKETEDARIAVAENEGTVEQYKEKKDVLIQKNQDGLEIITKKVITQSISSIPGSSVLKGAVKLTLNRPADKPDPPPETKVLFATRECGSGVDSDGCKVGAAKTDQDDTVPVHSGNVTICASRKNAARVVVSDVVVQENQTATVEREELPISEATEEKVKANDEGTYDPEEPVDTGDDTGTDDTGDTDVDTGGGGGDAAWLLCYEVDADLVYHYGCVMYHGDVPALEADALEAMGDCLSADYSRYKTHFSGVSSDTVHQECVAECLFQQNGGSYGEAVCDTPE